MAGPARGSVLLRATMMLAAALVLAPVVRGMTIGLNHSLGRVWPFSLGHCVSRNTPGCDTEVQVRIADAETHPAMRAAR